MTLQSLHDFWKEVIMKKRLFVINLLDVDDTFCASEFKKLKRIREQNKASLTPEFLQKLQDAEPFEWTKKGGQCWWIGDANIIVTGRPDGHHDITLEWFFKHFTYFNSFQRKFSCINIGWNDHLESDEASYKDYYTRKANGLFDLFLDWSKTLMLSSIDHVINIIEDDANVLRIIYHKQITMGTNLDVKLRLWMVKDGQMPVTYEEKNDERK